MLDEEKIDYILGKEELKDMVPWILFSLGVASFILATGWVYNEKNKWSKCH